MKLTTRPKKYCFVLMPFTEEFDDIYQLGIKQSCIDAGAYCERVDEQLFTESILDRVYNQISKADVIIADMTNRNPNVFYEVGYAHALGKTTILLTQKIEDIPFDLKHYPHIIYDGKISKLKLDLTTRVKWCVDNEIDKNDSLNIDIDIFLEDKSLSNKDVIYITKHNKIPHPRFTIYNNTFRTFNPGDYRVGVITDENYPRFRNTKGAKTTKLPDGRLLHMCPILEDILYPNYYTSFDVLLEKRLLNNETQEYYNDEQEVTIRIFTPTGTRDFFLTVRYE